MSILYGNINVKYNSELDMLPASVELVNKNIAKALDCEAIIVRRESNYLDADLWIRPQNTLYGKINVIEPPLIIHKIKPEKDSLVREKAPHINYGKSSSLSTGNTVEGKLESYLTFNIEEIKRNKNIESAKIKLYPTGTIDNNFSIDLFTASNKWAEYTIKYGYKPNKENYILSKTINKSDKVIEIDVLEYFQNWYKEQQDGYGHVNCSVEIKNPYGEDSLPPVILPDYDSNFLDDNNHKTFVITPTNGDIGSMYFGSRESYTPPILEVTYFDIPPNADSYTLDVDVQIAVNEEKFLDCEVDIDSNLIISHIPCDVEFEKKTNTSTVDCEVFISLTESSEVDASVTMENKNLKSELNVDMLLRAYRESFADIEFNIEKKSLISEIPIDAIIAVHDKSELDINIDLEKKVLLSEVECIAYIKGNEKSELEIEAILEKKVIQSEIPIDLTVAIHDKSELDAEAILENKIIISEIEADVMLENKTVASTLDATVLIPAYDNGEIPIDVLIAVPLTSTIDIDVELEKKNISSTVDIDCTMRAYGEGLVDVEFSMDKKELESTIDADVSIRAYGEGTVDIEVELTRKDFYENNIDISAEIENKKASAELEVDMILRAFWAEELECSVELGEGLEENDYAFII